METCMPHFLHLGPGVSCGMSSWEASTPVANLPIVRHGLSSTQCLGCTVAPVFVLPKSKSCGMLFNMGINYITINGHGHYMGINYSMQCPCKPCAHAMMFATWPLAEAEVSPGRCGQRCEPVTWQEWPPLLNHDEQAMLNNVVDNG